MITLDQFKKANGFTEIKFLKSVKTGRQVADLQGIAMIMSKKCDTTKPMYVTSATTQQNEPILVVCNACWAEGDTI
jgi:hypothetical protein